MSRLATNQLAEFEEHLEHQVRNLNSADQAHDIAHIKRVVASAKQIGEQEGADLNIIIPATWLHDCVAVTKDSPLRAQASQLAADHAIKILQEMDYPAHYFEAIQHAIAAHSYSARIAPQTPEARVVQDADRLDALGAIGIARCILVGGSLQRDLYDPDDIFCNRREADDRRYTLDHFFVKLFKLPQTMQTASGKREAERRVQFMRQYLQQLESETLHCLSDASEPV